MSSFGYFGSFGSSTGMAERYSNMDFIGHTMVSESTFFLVESIKNDIFGKQCVSKLTLLIQHCVKNVNFNTYLIVEPLTKTWSHLF